MKGIRKMMAAGLLLCGAVLPAAEPAAAVPAGRQIELCMIGDSITWAGEGDWFRRHLLTFMPELAFRGTHTAKWGYSHAGEGGNRTRQVLERLPMPDRVPDSRYYHLLVGVNDNASARDREQVPAVAARTVESIRQIVADLLKRPRTEKVFLGSLLPCGVDGDPASMKNQFRDLANMETNRIFREKFQEFFPDGRVVWVEYEQALRPRDDWRRIIRLHPTPDGYALIARILADSLKRNTTLPPPVAADRWGVEVTNLWSSRSNCSAPLIPGWYVASFDVLEVEGDTLRGKIASRFPAALKVAFARDFKLPAKPGDRVEVEFFTGAQGYGYDTCSMVVTPENGKVGRVQFEKMRPSRRASIYGEGTFLDAVSPMMPGEQLLPVR